MHPGQFREQPCVHMTDRLPGPFISDLWHMLETFIGVSTKVGVLPVIRSDISLFFRSDVSV